MFQNLDDVFAEHDSLTEHSAVMEVFVPLGGSHFQTTFSKGTTTTV
jgi:hypothetical protein